MTLGKISSCSMISYWRNPYVTDGLVAMWDGEWNAGEGIHDPAASTWKDLAGDNDLRLYGNCAFAENRLVLSRSDADAAYVAADNETTVSSTDGMTIEYVFKPIGFHNYSALVQFLPYGTSREGWIYANANCVPLRWGSSRGQFLVSNNEDVYVAAVIDNSDFKMKYYKNSVEASSGIAAANKTETCKITFFGANGYYFWGDAYAMRLYKRALTAEEIAANYAVDNERFFLTGGGDSECGSLTYAYVLCYAFHRRQQHCCQAWRAAA